MEKKLWSNAEVVELGIESTRDNEVEEAGFFTCNKRGCYELKVQGSDFCQNHQPKPPQTIS